MTRRVKTDRKNQKIQQLIALPELKIILVRDETHCQLAVQTVRISTVPFAGIYIDFF
ncbi:MAG: hypothetical protein GQ561_07980 [Calditrichae bacterium]|nr:hypothetical protein [Calditrichia bacterium]